MSEIKAVWRFAHFWEIDPLHQHGSLKRFFCVKFCRKRFRNYPNDFFRYFNFQHVKCYLVICHCFENGLHLRDKFWNLVCENHILSSERASFCFWRVLKSVASQKNLAPVATTRVQLNSDFSGYIYGYIQK